MWLTAMSARDVVDRSERNVVDRSERNVVERWGQFSVGAIFLKPNNLKS